MLRICCFLIICLIPFKLIAQLNWQNVDSLYQPLPKSVHVFKTTDSLDGKPNIAYYVIADLKDKNLEFTTDTTFKRRFTPTQFYQKNDHPLVIVNGTFFSFETNQNLNVVIKEGKLLGYNIHSTAGRGKDTLTYRHPSGSAIGISKKRIADVAWIYTDSSFNIAQASQWSIPAFKDSIRHIPYKYFFQKTSVPQHRGFEKWKMKTAIGGGPVLLQKGEIRITNNEELKFGGNAINDKHPRTAMGYTSDNKLIILVVQGRFPGIAEGANLTQGAQMLKDLGCIEALNLDGGGSSCLLVNGKATIQPSDKNGQRSIPAVFLIQNKK